MTSQSCRTGPVIVGVLSDTHGHLPAQVRRLLEGVDHVVHAGDVGSPQVLAELGAIAPVTAVRGNCDLDPWAESLPDRAEVELDRVRVVVGHIVGRLDAGRADVVITGHTHVAKVDERNGTLYVNPGAAGPKRFGRPRTLALLTIEPLPESAAAPGRGGVPRQGPRPEDIVPASPTFNGRPTSSGRTARSRVHVEIVIADEES